MWSGNTRTQIGRVEVDVNVSVTVRSPSVGRKRTDLQTGVRDDEEGTQRPSQPCDVHVRIR